MRLHSHLGSLPNAEMVPAWLHRVTVNVCFDLGRKRRPLVPLDGLSLVSSQWNPERQSLDHEDRNRLQSALAELGERERAALVLRDLEGLSTAQVAEAMGTTESTVRVQLAKARLKLRELLKGVQV